MNANGTPGLAMFRPGVEGSDLKSEVERRRQCNGFRVRGAYQPLPGSSWKSCDVHSEALVSKLRMEAGWPTTTLR